MTDDLLQRLVCPITRSKLRLETDAADAEGGILVSEIGGLRYPIRDGIPILLPTAAQLPPGIASLEEFQSKFPPPATPPEK